MRQKTLPVESLHTVDFPDPETFSPLAATANVENNLETAGPSKRDRCGKDHRLKATSAYARTHVRIRVHERKTNDSLAASCASAMHARTHARERPVSTSHRKRTKQYLTFC